MKRFRIEYDYEHPYDVTYDGSGVDYVEAEDPREAASEFRKENGDRYVVQRVMEV
jgi:hypothetical protein